MSLYTFFPALPDGASLTFETHELTDDVAAGVFAVTVMNRHPTCTHVIVWDGQREVCTRYRQPSLRSSNSRMANST